MVGWIEVEMGGVGDENSRSESKLNWPKFREEPRESRDD